MRQTIQGMRVLVLAAAFAAFLALSAAGQVTMAQLEIFGLKAEELYPLLEHPQVQKELILTSAQLDKIQSKREEMEELETPKEANGDERELTEEELPKVIAKLNAIKAKTISEVLTRRQQVRLTQIVAQMKGAPMLHRKPVLQALEATEVQQKAMLAAEAAAVQEAGAVQRQPNAKEPTPQERIKAMEKANAAFSAIVDKMIAVLTPAQQQKWRELVGPKFVMKLIARPAAGSGRP